LVTTKLNYMAQSGFSKGPIKSSQQTLRVVWTMISCSLKLKSLKVRVALLGKKENKACGLSVDFL